MAPLDEIQLLDRQSRSAADLQALKPLFERLDELLKWHSGDFEVQLVGTDLRQRLIQKGIELRNQPAVGAAALKPEPTKQPPSTAKPAAETPAAQPPNLKRAIMIGAGIGIVGWVILFVAFVQLARNRNMPKVTIGKPSTTTVDITTSPPGATIRINNEPKCTSNCRLELQAGNYQVTAVLEGHEPAATGVTVAAGPAIAVSLNLPASSQTVRIFTDLPSGKVMLDDKPAPDIEEGQLVLDRVAPGKHQVSIAAPNASAAFPFELVAGKAPVVGPIAASNVMAFVVTSFGTNARVLTNSMPLKVTLNGQPQGETSPNGLELKNVTLGDQEVTIGTQKVVVPVGQLPSLTVFLKSDANIGTLVVSTGEDDVSIYLNGRELKRKTKRGELRIPAIGPVTVRVTKEGFQAEAEQAAEVKKGEETRVAFRMRPLPQVAALQIQGAASGAQVFIDERSVGRVNPDGTFAASNLAPGDRSIELRHEGYVPKRLVRRLTAGQTLAISGPELTMLPSVGTLRLVLSPPDSQVRYRKAEESQSRLLRDTTVKLDPGSYIFTASASGHVDKAERVTVTAGETRNVVIALVKETVAPPPTKTTITTTEWDRTGWTPQDGQYVRKGGNRVPVRSGRLEGVITFTANLRKGGGIFRGGRLRWFLDDGKSVSQYELDKNHFYAKTDARDDKVPHIEDADKAYTVQIDVSPETVVHRMKIGERWVVLRSEPGRTIANGRFGFVIPGGDEIGVSDFRFTPR